MATYEQGFRKPKQKEWQWEHVLKGIMQSGGDSMVVWWLPERTLRPTDGRPSLKRRVGNWAQDCSSPLFVWGISNGTWAWTGWWFSKVYLLFSTPCIFGSIHSAFNLFFTLPFCLLASRSCLVLIFIVDAHADQKFTLSNFSNLPSISPCRFYTNIAWGYDCVIWIF